MTARASRTRRPPARRRTLAGEALFLMSGLALGVLAVPVAVYFAGSRVLGAYGGQAPEAFFASLYGDLVRLQPAALLLTLTPLASLYLLRPLLRRAFARG